MSRVPLDEGSVSVLLKELNKGLGTPWTLDNGRIRKEFIFRDFSEAFAFMTQAALVAERLNHHPDWCNVYRKVDVTLTTHDAGGLTTLDFEFARSLEAILQ